MSRLYNLARMSTSTTGTGTITLGSAVSGFLSFSGAGIQDGDTVTYAIADGSSSEIGRGVYTASGTTLTRSVLRSTNSNNAISLSGSAQVFISPAAEDFLTTVNAQTGTTYTVVSDDLGKLVTFSNASAIAVTLPQATGRFGAGWFTTLSNIGSSVVTITPTTSTIAGAATLTLLRRQSVRIVSTGANYVIERGAFSEITHNLPPGRLTLSTGVPVMTSTVAATGTLYYTPYVGNRIWLYDGTAGWDQVTFSELSIALSAGTASRPHDVFVYNNSGTATLELEAWTNDTTRATALTTQDGRYVKTGATTRLYLGTVYLDGSKQAQWTYGGAAAGGTAGVFDVWNMYNRVQAATFVSDTTDSWTYTTDTWRSANNSTGMRVTLVRGLSEDIVDASYMAVVSTSLSANAGAGVGVDSTSAASGIVTIAGKNGYAALALGRYAGLVSVGRHYVQALERSTASGTTTWFGDAGSFIASGMSFTFQA